MLKLAAPQGLVGRAVKATPDTQSLRTPSSDVNNMSHKVKHSTPPQNRQSISVQYDVENPC